MISNVGKYAKKAYKKVPKKKLFKKATSYSLKQLVGGPYLTALDFVYNKSKKKVISYAGSYAYDSLLRSKFAREKINTIPMTLVTIIVRSILNVLLFSKFVTGYKILDFTISVIITIIITLLSPFLYKSVEVHKDGFMSYTNSFMDRFMGQDGWEYIETVKNRSLLTIGLTIIMLLQFIEVNSRYLQEIIVHTLITGFISDQIQKYIETPKVFWFDTGYIGMQYIDPPIINILGPHNKIEYKYKPIHMCHTKNIQIMGMKPLKAKIIPRNNLRYHNITEEKFPTIRIKKYEIIPDYRK